MIKNITFEEILPIWEKELWPNRTSAIETHSAMIWPENSKESFETDCFKYHPYFLGIYQNKQLIAVNSLHQTKEKEARSRGLWVAPNYRRRGLGVKLLKRTIEFSEMIGCEMIWSFPRADSLPVYQKLGFISFSGPTDEGEFGPNYYVYKKLL